MSPDELARALRDVLAAEREAIRSLDAAEVERAAHEKERLLAIVASAPVEARAPYVAALAEARGELRRNLILLAHARDCVREALSFVSPSAGRRVLVDVEV